MSRRPARLGVLLALWLAAAAGALLLGLFAVGFIGSGLTGGGSTPPLSESEIEARLAVPPPPEAIRPVRAADAPAVVVPAGPGGTVVARCVGDSPEVVSINPAQGFESSGEDDGGATVKLEGDDVEVRVTLSCGSGRPVGTVVVEQDD